jgi:hypothetical protein
MAWAAERGRGMGSPFRPQWIAITHKVLTSTGFARLEERIPSIMPEFEVHLCL